MGKTCFFIGHRNTPPSVMPDLEAAIDRHIVDYGVRHFIVGGCGAFDSMAARAVAEAKQRHIGLTLTRLLPGPPGQDAELLPAHFDGVWYPNNPLPRAAMYDACCTALLHADYLICYRAHSSGDAAALVDQAELLAQSLPIHLTKLPAQPIRFDP